VFTSDDFWRVFKLLKDDYVDPRLDANTVVLAESEQSTAKKLFTNTIDQQCHMTNDYKRFRSFLNDWYASLRTLTSTQKNISDVYSLPSDHVTELIKSFGFEYGLRLVPLKNKVNLFLDLVNLYKKKGTPEALADVLDYFGFSDADIIEYWLEKNNADQLIFKGHNVRRSAAGSTTLLDEDVSFDNMTGTDPHWMMSEDEIRAGIENNSINLPSKSPYFSLTSIFYMGRIHASTAIMNRAVQEEYTRHVTNGLELFKNINVKSMSGTYSLLETYLATIYVFQRIFGATSTSDSLFSCYDGTVQWSGGDPSTLINLDQKIIEYENLMSTPPTDRDDRTTRLQTFEDEWSRPMSSHFISSPSDAETILTAINPDFKTECDLWFTQQEESFLIMYLIGALDNWVRANIDSGVPSLVVTVLGFGFREEVSKIIEFFKPYRARLAFLDTAYSINNPLTESIRLDEGDMELMLWHYITDTYDVSDELHMVIEQTFTENFNVGCSGTLYYDIGELYDMIGCWQEEIEVELIQIITETVQPTESVQTNIEWTYDGDMPRGEGGPMIWDMGGSFDTPTQAPIVDDREHLEIVVWPPFPEEEITVEFTEFIRGEQGPAIWDSGGSFDTPVQAPVADDRDHVLTIVSV
jgi:hypothetical protein